MSDMSNGTRRRRSSRLTPYRSSRTRSLGPGSSIEDFSASDGGQHKVVERLAGKTCHTHRLSPLWRFDPRAVHEYSRHLTGLLRALPRSTAKEWSQQRVMGNVAVIKDFDPSGADAVVVTIKLGRASAPLATALLYRNTEPQKPEKGFSYYPVLLVQGPVAVSQVVIDWIKTSFDCRVTAPQLHEDLLHSLAAKYATTLKRSSGRGDKVGKLVLVYELAEVVKKAGLSTITLELPYDSAMALSEGNLHKTLEQMIETHFHLKLSTLKLVQISTPVLTLNYSGVVKCQVTDHMIPVLASIQQGWLST